MLCLWGFKSQSLLNSPKNVCVPHKPLASTHWGRRHRAAVCSSVLAYMVSFFNTFNQFPFTQNYLPSVNVMGLNHVLQGKWNVLYQTSKSPQNSNYRRRDLRKVLQCAAFQRPRAACLWAMRCVYEEFHPFTCGSLALRPAGRQPNSTTDEELLLLG